MLRDAAALLYGNAAAGIFITFVTSTFLVFAFDNPAIREFKHAWWLVMSVLMAFRTADLYRWRVTVQHAEFNGRKATLRFITGANITAVMWSLYSVSIASNTDSIELTTTIITVAAMAGGSATVLAGHKFTAMFYAFILLAPTSIVLLLSDQYELRLLGILGFLFSIVMLIISKKSADITTQTIILKNENAVLVNHMEAQVKERTQKIYELSNIDPLTGLFNRTAFLSQLKDALESSKASGNTLALLFIDLDGFKKINDSIGHQAGDQILAQTAKRLKSGISNNQLLCRWGGDEFLVALVNTKESETIDIAFNLIKSLTEAHTFDDNCLSVGATIGIAFYPVHATSEQRLIQLADTAMYHQKHISRGSVGIFSAQMEAQLNQELKLRHGLAEALEKQQMRLVFQPIVVSDSCKIIGFEALLRWSLNGENIPPDEFIGIAEQHGLIQTIGAWVLTHACKAASEWDPAKKLAVCVNVSVMQLQSEDFIETVDSALSDSRLLPELLHIEITESVFASDKILISQKIKALQYRGVKVSIDDFGTGYSSLSAIQDLAVNVVKIDRSFVNRLDSNGFPIIKAVMHIATSLDFSVVAEGVETEKQMHQLLDLGVDFQQGFYFSKPVELSEVPDLINKKP